VFLAWALPMGLLLIPVNLLVFRRAIPEHLGSGAGDAPSSVERFGAARALRFLSQDYFASIFTQVTLTLLPLMVLALLGPRDSAYFAIPFMIVMAFDTLAYSACTPLVVEAGLLKEGHLRDLANLVVRRVLVLLVPAAVLLILAAPLVLMPFGHAYVQHGTGVLRLLLCASLFRAGIAFFSAVSRVQGRGLRLALTEFALLVLVIVPATPLANAYGIDGIGAAWLIANAVIFLTLLPRLLPVLREPRVSSAVV
jgi:O-antigen/teichoic acid export membrane protein